ncbi:MAG: hypothetical protein AB7V27_20105 [Candidatus Binatia bacterium]
MRQLTAQWLGGLHVDGALEIGEVFYCAYVLTGGCRTGAAMGLR